MALTDEEINLLYENNLPGVSSAESLLNTVWLNNIIHFGMGACQEHRDLCWGEVKLATDVSGDKYMVYTLKDKQKRDNNNNNNDNDNDNSSFI